jgi:hypothetical protein
MVKQGKTTSRDRRLTRHTPARFLSWTHAIETEDNTRGD